MKNTAKTTSPAFLKRSLQFNDLQSSLMFRAYLKTDPRAGDMARYWLQTRQGGQVILTRHNEQTGEDDANVLEQVLISDGQIKGNAPIL